MRGARGELSLKSTSKKSGLYPKIFSIQSIVFKLELLKLSTITVLYPASSKATTQ